MFTNWLRSKEAAAANENENTKKSNHKTQNKRCDDNSIGVLSSPYNNRKQHHSDGMRYNDNIYQPKVVPIISNHNMTAINIQPSEYTVSPNCFQQRDGNQHLHNGYSSLNCLMTSNYSSNLSHYGGTSLNGSGSSLFAQKFDSLSKNYNSTHVNGPLILPSNSLWYVDNNSLIQQVNTNSNNSKNSNAVNLSFSKRQIGFENYMNNQSTHKENMNSLPTDPHEKIDDEKENRIKLRIRKIQKKKMLPDYIPKEAVVHEFRPSTPEPNTDCTEKEFNKMLEDWRKCFKSFPRISQ